MTIDNKNNDNVKKTKTLKILLMLSITSMMLISGGITLAYADGVFAGKNIFGSTANVASGANSVAFGSDTISSNLQSAAFGGLTTASGGQSTAFGYNTTASGHQSTAFGFGSTAQPLRSFVIGQYNEISGEKYTWVDTEPLFVIGNGADSSNPHNAVTVLKNGNVGIGTTLPSHLLSVNGTIESTFGGFMFPDGTIQTTSNTGNIENITAGTGLSGGGNSGNVTLNVDTSTIQNRVTGSCSVGSSISAINEDGTVSCETGDNPWIQTNSTISYTDGNVSIDNLTLTGDIIPDGDFCIGKCQ